MFEVEGYRYIYPRMSKRMRIRMHAFIWEVGSRKLANDKESKMQPSNFIMGVAYLLKDLGY